jgi:hypothetical protein
MTAFISMVLWVSLDANIIAKSKNYFGRGWATFKEAPIMAMGNSGASAAGSSRTNFYRFKMLRSYYLINPLERSEDCFLIGIIIFYAVDHQG